MKSYSKLQLLEVLAMQRQILLQRNCSPDHLETFDAFADTFVQVLDGKLRPAAKDETILVPGFGFVPLVGTIGQGGKITFFKNNRQATGDER